MSNIFIVDDSISVRKALEMILGNKGMNVRSAVSAETALARIDEEPVDLIIADVVMPGMSGIEMCAKLKEDERYADIPVLIISGTVDEETQARTKESGALELLKKPFDQPVFLAAVERALETGRLARESAEGGRQKEAAETQPHEVASVVEVIESDFSTTPSEPAQASASAPEVDIEEPAAGESPFSFMLDNAMRDHNVTGALLVDHAGNVIESRGNDIPPKIGMFVRFFTGTANTLALEMGEKSMTQIDLELGGRRVLIRGISDKLMVTLRRL